MKTNLLKYYFLLAMLAGAFLSAPAQAGHLFTQASANTPINLTAGNGIQITQLTFESVGTSGNISLNFSTDWGTGDSIQINIGSWTRTLSYSSPLSGTTQTASALVVNDPTLAAAGIQKSASMQWTVVATAGSFTFTGYRIYVSDGTFNGTGAAPINQSQVVSASQLNGGGSLVPAATSANTGLAQTLDALNGNATGQLNTVITLISAMTDESKQLALKLLAPETSQAVGHSAVNTAAAALDTVQLRLDAVRTGTGMTSRFEHHENDAADAASTEGMSSGDESLKKHMWMKVFGGKGSQDAKDGYAGFNDSLYGTMIGYDDSVRGGWLLGAAVGYANTEVDMADYRAGDGATIKTYQVTGYFARSFGAWYLNGMLTYAAQDYRTTRNTHFTGTAVGDFQGSLYGLRVLAGVPMAMREDLTVTPYGGVEVNHINQESYMETGAGAASYNVTGNSVSRVRSVLGGEVATMVKLEKGAVLRPSAKLNWRHEFNDKGVNTVASLTGGGGEFMTVGQAINRNIYGLSLRLNWERSEASNIAVELTGEAGSGYSNVSAQVVGGWRF